MMFLKEAMKARMPVIVITTTIAMLPQYDILVVYLLCRTKNRDGKMKLNGTKPMEPTIPITSAAENCLRK